MIKDGDIVGNVTSCEISPTLNQIIGLAYAPRINEILMSVQEGPAAIERDHLYPLSVVNQGFLFFASVRRGTPSLRLRGPLTIQEERGERARDE